MHARYTDVVHTYIYTNTIRLDGHVEIEVSSLFFNGSIYAVCLIVTNVRVY